MPWVHQSSPWARIAQFSLACLRRTKSFEGKLATLTAINSALQTENDKLRKQLAEAEAPKTKGDAEVAGGPTFATTAHSIPPVSCML